MSPPALDPGRVWLWVDGARPRTLGATLAPFLVGTAVAAAEGRIVPWRAGAVLICIGALQIGTNYANDYSDGCRGVDAQRVGPLRLTASGLVEPASVRRAAIASFAVAGATSVSFAFTVDPKFAIAGPLAIAAGALYTGGPSPYGYTSLGEAAVFLCFGMAATLGAAYVHLRRFAPLGIAASVPVGLLAAALLVTNNLRDVETDRESGKTTLVVRLGELPSIRLFRSLVGMAFVSAALIASKKPAALLALAAAPLASSPWRAVRPGADGPTLVGALRGTARLQLAFAALLAAGLWPRRARRTRWPGRAR
ncbi:MAG: 1,4-dihydroxy-2-naphthoate polyprenyltransferase [Acidimicrobiia bacterium]